MVPIKVVVAALFTATTFTVLAQQKKAVAPQAQGSAKGNLTIPISKADLGTFPYVKTLRNFQANDSVTFEQNRVYFFDGIKYFTIDGRVSKQTLNIKNRDQPIVSEFGCIQEFDKIVSALGGIKVYAGKLPTDGLKAISGDDIITVDSKGQVTSSAFYGVVEYVIKTPEKEVWIQLEPYSLASKFYTLLIVEKSTPLISLNTNKRNQVLDDLEKSKKSIVQLSFEPDKETVLTESKDELLSILGVFQTHPDWKLRLECHNAPVGKPESNVALTEKRANALKQELVKLGVKDNSIDAKGMGDQKPLASNDTEQGRLTNIRIELSRQ